MAELDYKKMAEAFMHPTQVRILKALAEEGESSPSKIAAKLDEKPGNVAYHVSVLREKGVIKQTRSEPVRGAMEHYYEVA